VGRALEPVPVPAQGTGEAARALQSRRVERELLGSGTLAVVQVVRRQRAREEALAATEAVRNQQARKEAAEVEQMAEAHRRLQQHPSHAGVVHQRAQEQKLLVELETEATRGTAVTLGTAVVLETAAALEIAETQETEVAQETEATLEIAAALVPAAVRETPAALGIPEILDIPRKELVDMEMQRVALLCRHQLALSQPPWLAHRSLLLVPRQAAPALRLLMMMMMIPFSLVRSQPQRPRVPLRVVGSMGG
jgi:hypothetical protein